MLPPWLRGVRLPPVFRAPPGNLLVRSRSLFVARLRVDTKECGLRAQLPSPQRFSGWCSGYDRNHRKHSAHLYRPRECAGQSVVPAAVEHESAYLTSSEIVPKGRGKQKCQFVFRDCQISKERV